MEDARGEDVEVQENVEEVERGRDAFRKSIRQRKKKKVTMNIVGCNEHGEKLNVLNVAIIYLHMHKLFFAERGFDKTKILVDVAN